MAALKPKRRSDDATKKRSCCLSGFGCFPSIVGKKVEIPGVENLEMNAVNSGESPVPKHLVMFCNGIIGSPANWNFAAEQFVKRFPEDVIAHCSACNTSMLTFDGVDTMGERLAEEVISVIKLRPEVSKISFVAHSLGGLIARYAIGRLYGQSPTREPTEDIKSCSMDECGTQRIEEKYKGKIAGLEPMNFITFATPHLGSRAHRQIPILCGFQILEKAAFHSSWIVGRTGKHLLFKDKSEGTPPLLLRMVTDCGDLKFMSALQSFRRRVAYSNVCFDHIVGWSTASIRYQHELPKLQHLPKHDKYPHVINVEMPTTVNAREEVLLESEVKNKDIQGAIIEALNSLGWEKVDVSFLRSKQRYFSHSTIQVKTYCINSDGADVIFHLIDNFLL